MREMVQGAHALIKLRDMILTGSLRAGERVRELALVEMLELSRTPIRYALAKLVDEGLLEKAGGGLVVREFSREEIRDAIQLRGALEGMAARTAAENGAAADLLPFAWQCVDELEEVLDARRSSQAQIDRYVDINHRFHNLLAQISDSFVIQRTINHICSLPFASPNAFVMAHRGASEIRKMMIVSQHQHRTMLEAIERGDGARAEAIAREHAELSLGAMHKIFEEADNRDQATSLNLMAETAKAAGIRSPKVDA